MARGCGRFRRMSRDFVFQVRRACILACTETRNGLPVSPAGRLYIYIFIYLYLYNVPAPGWESGKRARASRFSVWHPVGRFLIRSDSRPRQCRGDVPSRGVHVRPSRRTFLSISARSFERRTRFRLVEFIELLTVGGKSVFVQLGRKLNLRSIVRTLLFECYWTFPRIIIRFSPHHGRTFRLFFHRDDRFCVLASRWLFNRNAYR